LGVSFALIERQRSNRGQYLEVALYDAGLSLLHPHAANHLLDGRIPRRTGNAHPNICPYDTFRTGTEPIFLAVGNERQFATLCREIGAEALASDPRFASNAERSAHRVALKALLEEHLGRFECRPLADRLVRAGVPCAAIQSVATALADPHTRHRGMVVGIGEGYRGVASPIKLARTPATYRSTPPARTDPG
jgi:crotonobetainyl-CoA:carnitine CoA-transferase CaiB-like acyl-CoA transferase